VDGTAAPPTLWRIISTDYWALVGAIVPCVGTGFWIANAFFGFPGKLGRPPLPPNHPLFIGLGAAGVIGGALLLTARRRFFDALFTSGHRARGTITSVRFLRDRGRLEFTFEYQGQLRCGGNAVHRTKRTAALRAQQAVTVLVNPARPENAIILDLYV
jgi:hypothetical protein